MKAIVRNGICRYCYKRLFNIKLNARDCKCDYYKNTCPACKEEHHLVAQVSWFVRFRLLFKKSPKIDVETMSEGYVIGEKDCSID